MAVNLTILNGAGDGTGDGTGTFSGNPGGGVGQILASDASPIDIFESELQGLSPTINVVLEATNNIILNDILTANRVVLQSLPNGGGTIRFNADRLFSYLDVNDTISAPGRSFSATAVEVNIGNIDVARTFDGTSDVGNGGTIALSSSGNISAFNLNVSTSTTTGNAGNTGAITLNSFGNISTSVLNSSSITTTGVAGSTGAIALSSFGNISTSVLSSSSTATTGSSGATGTIRLNSLGNISTSDLSSSSSATTGNSASVGNAGNAGAIAISSLGRINTSNLSSSSAATTGDAGNGGAITLSSGQISTFSLNSFSAATTGVSGNGGTITLNSLGQISTFNLNSFSSATTGDSRTGGAIAISSSGNISTFNLSSSSSATTGNSGNGGAIAFNSLNISTFALDTSTAAFTGDSGNGGAIALNADTTNGIINTNNQNISSYSQSNFLGSAGSGGAINLTAAIINGTSSISSQANRSGTGFGNTDNGGAVTINATNSSLNITNAINTFSQSNTGNTGNGGAITITSSNNISLTNITVLNSSSSAPSGNAGNAGAITLTANILTGTINGSNQNISTFSSVGALDTGISAGGGGAITLTAANINIGTGTISTYSNRAGTGVGMAGNGGAVTINATNSSLIITNAINSFSQTNSGNAGNGGAIALDAININVNNLFTYAATGNGNTGNGGNINLTATNNLDTQALNNFNTVTVNYGNITLTGNEINLNGGNHTVLGTGKNLILQSSNASQVIQIGSVDSGNVNILDITATDLAAIADGFSSITIGRSNSTGSININSNLNFSDPIILSSSHINLNSTISFTDNGSINFTSFANLNPTGAIALRNNEQIGNTADLNLNGGSLIANGFNETLDLLKVSSNSSINFGNGASAIAFSNSSNQTWAGNLTISNWNSITGETLRFGNSSSGLTSSQLAQIQYTGLGTGAKINNLGFVTPTFLSPTPVDFNGDRKSDILWRDSSDNAVFWSLSGNTATSIVISNQPPDYTIQAVGDFNGDGKADILLRNRGASQNKIWFMNGNTIASEGPTTRVGSTISDTSADQFWSIKGTGDFNGDGKSDILWQNVLDNSTVIWFMNGTEKSGAVTSDLQTSNYLFQAVGDFNGDGKADILWRDRGTGLNQIWLMDGANITNAYNQRFITRAGSSIPDTSADFPWTVQGAGDFDGDGKTDILWRNALNFQTVIWRMDGTAKSGAVTSLDQFSKFDVQAIGDYDRDGKADILWRDSSSGDTQIWYMSGQTVLTVGNLNAPSATGLNIVQ